MKWFSVMYHTTEAFYFLPSLCWYFLLVLALLLCNLLTHYDLSPILSNGAGELAAFAFFPCYFFPFSIFFAANYNSSLLLCVLSWYLSCVLLYNLLIHYDLPPILSNSFGIFCSCLFLVHLQMSFMLRCSIFSNVFFFVHCKDFETDF